MNPKAHASQSFERPGKRRHLNPELTEEDSKAEAHSGKSEAAEEVKVSGPPHLAEITQDWMRKQIWCLKGQRYLKIT